VSDVSTGSWDKKGLIFSASSDPVEIDAIRISHTLTDVSFGLSQVAFGSPGLTISAKATVVQGAGNATTGDVGGPGLENGHFDVDTVAASANCSGSSCSGTTKHTHEYDDQFDVTSVNLFAPLDSHLAVNGCLDSKKKPVTCSSSTTRVIPDTQTFRITIVNADLSPGAWLTVNGVDYPVTEWDDTAFSSLTTFSLGSVAGATRLTSLSINFDVDAIASCELHPTNTNDVKANTAGGYGEWRNGALTIQLVKTTATSTSGKSAGDHDAVVSAAKGLLWESTYFWHWDGESYHKSGWQSDHDALVCSTPIFVD
jgi:hypothetical protein